MGTRIGLPQGNCPVQSWGEIDGNPYYFRARHEHWTMDIVKPGTDPVLPRGENLLLGAAGYVGEWPSAGWMPEEDAVAIIEGIAKRFSSGERGSIRCSCGSCAKFFDAYDRIN